MNREENRKRKRSKGTGKIWKEHKMGKKIIKYNTIGKDREADVRADETFEEESRRF